MIKVADGFTQRCKFSEIEVGQTFKEDIPGSDLFKRIKNITDSEGKLMWNAVLVRTNRSVCFKNFEFVLKS